MVTKTIGRLHFDDLDPIRFEELCLSVVYRMRRWMKLDHLGKVGTDGGVDIQAQERLENGKVDVHHFQCKRYKNITKSQITRIVADYCSNHSSPPDYYYLIVGCDVSKDKIEHFESLCRENGILHVAVWSASILEAILYDKYHDLLFVYFGINMTEKRNNRIESIRRNLAVKKKMHSDFYKSFQQITNEERRLILEEPWRKFLHGEVLVRSIYDTSYPDNTLCNYNGTGYFKAEVYDFYHNGLMVRAHPYCVDAIIKGTDNGAVKEEQRRIKLETMGCIAFENIIAYDVDGDEYYNYPHLYCDFINTSDPFDAIRYRASNGRWVDKKEIVEFL